MPLSARNSFDRYVSHSSAYSYTEHIPTVEFPYSSCHLLSFASFSSQSDSVCHLQLSNAYLTKPIPHHPPQQPTNSPHQVWLGVAAGILICLIICAGVIGTFYTAGRNSFEAAENIWEGVFGIVASIIITLMGAALLRVSKLQDKWRVKISKVLESKDAKLPVKGRLKRWGEKYAMFILPFITVLREGIEAVL